MVLSGLMTDQDDTVQSDNRDQVGVVDFATLKAWAQLLLDDSDQILGETCSTYDPDFWSGINAVAFAILERCDDPAGFTIPESPS